MFTNSPDKHFIIDLHPEYPQVSFAAGFSGHGYKFASVIGEIMADLAERRESRHNITLFNVARLTGKVSDLYKELPGMRVSAKPVRYARISQRQSSQRRGSRLQSKTERRMISPQRRFQSEPYLESNDPRYWNKEDVEPFW